MHRWRTGCLAAAVVVCRGSAADRCRAALRGHPAHGTQTPGGNRAVVAFAALSGLVDKSLVDRADVGGHTRLHMLETVRAYGLERLRENSHGQSFVRRHRAYFLDLAARAGAAYGSAEQADWLRRLRPEHSNLRQIVTAAPPAGEPAEAVLRAAQGLWLHCLTSGRVGEGAHWMRVIIDRHPCPSESPGALFSWCRAAWVAGFLLLMHGDHDNAEHVIGMAHRSLTDLSASPAPHMRRRRRTSGPSLQPPSFSCGGWRPS